MEVILLTSLFSVVFAVLFLSLFLRERQVREFGGLEREALMPLDDADDTDFPRTRVSNQQPRRAACSGKHGDEKKCCQGCPCQK